MLALEAELPGVAPAALTVHVMSAVPAVAIVTVVVAAVAALNVTPALGEALH